MSQYGNTRPIEGLVRRGMNQPIPDLTQPPPVAVPGLDVLAPAPSGLAGQVANVFEGAVGLTMAGARFANMMRERDQQEFEAQQDYQARTNKMFLQVAAEAEKQASEVFVGDAKKKWSVDRQVLSGQLQRGELPLPSDFKEETLKAWVKNTVQSRVGNGTGVYEQTYETLATDELLGMVQGAKASVLAKDQAEIVSSLASAAAIAPDAETLKRNVAQTMALTNMSERGATFAVVLPGAGEAASAGSANYETVFRPLLADKPEYALQLNALDLAWNKAKDEQAREAIRIKNAEQRDIELATQRDIKAFYDVVNSDLAANATDENSRYQRAATWLDKVRGTMERQPEKATELNGLQNQLESIVNSIDTKRERMQIEQTHASNMDSVLQSARNAYKAGNSWAIEDKATSRVQLSDGSVNEKSITGLRKMAQEAEFASAKTFNEQAALAQTDSLKYEPWTRLLDAAALQADAAMFVSSDPTKQSAIAKTTIDGVSLYMSLAAYNPELANKYAGDNADFYQSVAQATRMTGIGNNVEAAVQHVVAQRKNSGGRAIEIGDRELAPIVSDVDTRNGMEYASYVAAEAERQQRVLGKPKGEAVEAAQELAKSQWMKVNNFSVRTYGSVLPPGVYGSAEKTFEAVVSDIASKHGMKSEDVSLKIDPANGAVVLWDYANGTQAFKIPLEDRVIPIDAVYKRAKDVRLKEISTPWIDLKGGTFNLGGLGP